MSATLKDIAKVTGVSIAAVSLVLNKKPIRISEEKRAEIIRTARELNYKTNQAARSLVTMQSDLLGLIVPDIENTYFSRLAKYLEKKCIENNKVLLILNSNELLSTDLRLLDILVSRQIDGIFICPSYESFQSPEFRDRLEHIGVPVVMVDRVYDDAAFSRVYFDNTQSAFAAVELLIRNGHEKIAIIAPPQNADTGYSRLEGYKQAHLAHGIPIDQSSIYFGDYSFQSGYNAGQEILKTDVTAVFSCNDGMTLGFLKALREAQLKIPEDISLISNDNIPEDFSFGISITTIVQNVNRLAEEAYSCLERTTSAKSTETRILRPELFIRGSIRSLKK